MNEQLISTSEAVLQQAGLLDSKATVLVALSGGADSVALLLTLHALQKTHGFSLLAVHVEHGLRGNDSLADATFCQQLCSKLGVPFSCEHAMLTGDMHDAGIEALARKARYALLFQKVKLCNANALLLAHHQDDQAETVLQHLIRGSGTHGLSGMQEISYREGIMLCRPFLSLPKQALLDALGDQPYQTDATNAMPVCQRNRIRSAVLPQLVCENTAAVQHIAQSATLLSIDDQYLQSQADTLLADALLNTPPYFCLRKAVLSTADPAILIRTLRRFVELGLQAIGTKVEDCSLSAEDSLSLLKLMSAKVPSTINLPGALHATVTEHYLHVTHMQDDAPLCPVPAITAVSLSAAIQSVSFGAITVHKMPYSHGISNPDGLHTIVLPREVLQQAVLRQPQAGDTIHPFGAKGRKPFRRYITDHKVDIPFRQQLPVVAIGQQILWAIGIGAAEATRIQDTPSLLLTLQGTLPWLQ